MRTLYKEKGPVSRIRCEVAHRGTSYQASDRPIIPSALLTKNIMPISGDLLRGLPCVCLPWDIFFCLLLLSSIPFSFDLCLLLLLRLSFSFFLMLYGKLVFVVSFHFATLCQLSLPRSSLALQPMRATGCYRKTRAKRFEWDHLRNDANLRLRSLSGMLALFDS